MAEALSRLVSDSDRGMIYEFAMHTIAGLRKTRHRGKAPVGWMFTFAAAFNPVRMRNLAQAAA